TLIGSGSKGNCYMIDDGYSRILLDAGVPFRKLQEAINYESSVLDGVLITHEHGDHCKAVDKLARRNIPIFASQPTLRVLKPPLEKTLAGRSVKAGTDFFIFSRSGHRPAMHKVLPFRVNHDAVKPLGFLIESVNTGERVLYFTDTAYLDYVFANVDIVIGECNYSEEILRQNVANSLLPESHANRVRKTHFALDNYLDMLDAMKGKERLKLLVIAHLSDGNSNEEAFVKAVEKKLENYPKARVIAAKQNEVEVYDV
ncbi:MAG: MBL fold metallo-hydrolase, partial [Eubacterium sp.]